MFYRLYHRTYLLALCVIPIPTPLFWGFAGALPNRPRSGWSLNNSYKPPKILILHQFPFSTISPKRTMYINKGNIIVIWRANKLSLIYNLNDFLVLISYSRNFQFFSSLFEFTIIGYSRHKLKIVEFFEFFHWGGGAAQMAIVSQYSVPETSSFFRVFSS